MNIAVVGATGLVGQKMIEVLEERHIAIDNIFFLASKSSAGKVIHFKAKDYIVLELTPSFFEDNKVDYALFSAGGEISKIFAPIAVKNNCVVIDNSSYWRMNKDVPLIVPEVNKNSILSHKGIIANPNCSTIQLVVALNNIHKKFKIKRLIISTYQSVTGSGKKAVDQLMNEINNVESNDKAYPHKIAFNAIPHIDVFLDNGYSKEEQKMIDETKKIFNDDEIQVTATAVRIPTYGGHSESVNIECEKAFHKNEIFEILKHSESVVLVDDLSNNKYPMPLDAHNKDEVFVGRVRLDSTRENALNMWIVSDNLRKGAATNAVQILEALL